MGLFGDCFGIVLILMTKKNLNNRSQNLNESRQHLLVGARIQDHLLNIELLEDLKKEK